MNDAADQAETRPRYSDLPLPPYSYVPGHAPHPVSNPRGHLHGAAHVPAPPLDPDTWRQSSAYLYAIDLFNHGFYWEAHEAWESLWHAAGRAGVVASWLKALIKLAAAAVKLREGNAAGVERHSRRALQLLAEVRSELPREASLYCGLRLDGVEAVGHSLARLATEITIQPKPELLLTQWLELADA